MVDDGKASRLEHVIAWAGRWWRFARVGRVAARNPVGRLIGALLLIPVVVLVLVVVGIVRVVTG
jgi:hypothetical protein